MENEAKCQLRRQAMAHSDIINDSMNIQAAEMKRRHNIQMEKTVSSERSTHQNEISKLCGTIEGIKAIVRSKANTEIVMRETLELWLASKAFESSLMANSLNYSKSSPLDDEIKAITNIANRIFDNLDSKDKYTAELLQFVHKMIKSVPREALERGVYSDKALRDRYFHVESVAKRTALIKNENASLFMYLLSYLQSLVMFAPNTEKAKCQLRRQAMAHSDIINDSMNIQAAEM